MAIPLLVAGGIAAAGALAKGAAAAAGAGKNRRAAQSFFDPSGKTGYNPNAANWGGKAGGQQEYERNLHNSQMGVESRGAPTANYEMANWDRMQSGQARDGQNQAAALMLNRAKGVTPSIASQQAAMDSQRAVAAQQSAAASARGPAGIALAQQQAANNTANAQSQISGQAQINAANERLAAEQAASGAYTGMRAGDLQSQSQVAQQEQFQAQQQLASRNANDQRAMGYEQLKYGSNVAQLNSKMQEQGILAQSHNAKEGLQQQTAQANANREGQQVDSIIGGISDMGKTAAGAGAMGSDERMKVQYRAAGGPVAAGRPYVVGEQGPELVVPSQAGTVVPAGQTRALLGKGGRRPPTTKEMLDDRANQAELTAPVDQGGPSLDSMLDDRAQQTAPDGIGKEALHTGIENQIVRDRDPQTQAERDQAMIEQWERSTGQTAQQARDDVRTSDNKAEMAKTNARLGTGGGKEKPWYMTDVSGISMTGSAPTQSVSSLNGRSVWAGGNSFESDDRAKLAAAWDAGRKSAGDDLQRYQSMSPEELQQASNKDRLADSLRVARRDTWDAALMTAQDKIDAEEAPPEPEFVAPPIASTLPPKREPKPATMMRNMSTPMRRRSLESDERAKMRLDNGPLADANRKMKGEPYMYKDGHVPMHEKPGQPHFGFMAQNLEKNPISATAVDEGPDGMKRVDRDRMLQVMASGLSDLQRQQDELRAGLNKGGRKKKAA